MGDAEIEGAQDQGPAVGVIVGGAEVVPETEREKRQLESAATAGTVERGIVVTGGGGLMGHGKSGKRKAESGK